MGGKGGVIGAAIGTLTVNFLNTGLVFNVTPAFMVQLYLGVLLIVVIMFQTGSRVFDESQRRKQILADTDMLAKQLAQRRQKSDLDSNNVQFGYYYLILTARNCLVWYSNIFGTPCNQL